MQQEHYLRVKRTARIYTIGDTQNYSELWIVCHGYAQLASEFLINFEPLKENGVLIVAPEALSRFYKKGFFGEVGANWMTREDRDNEIADQLTYLNEVYDHFVKNSNKARIRILGFSQGVATVSRWLSSSGRKADSLICWAGEFPPDLKDLDPFRNVQLISAWGDADPFVNPSVLETIRKRYSDYQLDPEQLSFSGAHEIPEAALIQLKSILL